MQAERAFDLQLGDVVQLRKPHPCGSLAWRVVRLGADIGLTCLGCGHRVLMPRSALARRLRGAAVPHADNESETRAATAAPDPALPKPTDRD